MNDYSKYYRPAIVDITPTIARFMNISIPKQQLNEMDGMPLIGKLSVAKLEVNMFQDKLDVGWKALDKEGVARIWVSTTNNFNKGKQDDYRLLAEVPVTAEHTMIDVSNFKSSFYKVVVEAKYNSMNRWVLVKNDQ